MNLKNKSWFTLRNMSIVLGSFILGVISVLFLFGGFLVPNGFLSTGFKSEDVKQENVEDENPIPEPYLYENFTPPSNSFGMGNTTFKTVNWSYFKQLFNQHCSWMLEYNLGSGWQDGSEYLTIEKSWNESLGGWKFNLILTKPPSP